MNEHEQPEVTDFAEKERPCEGQEFQFETSDSQSIDEG